MVYFSLFFSCIGAFSMQVFVGVLVVFFRFCKWERSNVFVAFYQVLLGIFNICISLCSAQLHFVCMSRFYNGTQHWFNTCSALSFCLTESHSGHIMLHVRFVEEIYDCSTEEKKRKKEEEPHSVLWIYAKQILDYYSCS